MHIEPNRSLPRDDLLEIVRNATADLNRLNGARILVLGSTGFVGTWLCQALALGARELELDCSLTMVSRNPMRGAEFIGELAPDIRIDFAAADINRPLRGIGHHDVVINLATSASAELNRSAPDLMRSTIVGGMRNLLGLIDSWTSCRMVFTSSGAVYGMQEPELARVPESYVSEAPEQPDPYRDGKREAEALLAESSTEEHPAVAARLFAFLGPGLPLDAHFAAGNFIRDASSSHAIRIHGDGRTVRSYQYPTDMCAWLLALASRPTRHFAYNVGSPHSVTLSDLALKIAERSPQHPRVEVLGSPRPVHRYVPDTTRIEEELGVGNKVELEDAIGRTLRWIMRSR